MHEETSPHLLPGVKDRRLGAEQEKLLCGSTGTSSGNCQGTETRMARACYTCHVTRHILSKTILAVTLEGWRCRGWQGKFLMDNIKEWTSLLMPELLTRVSCKKDWKRISGESSLLSHRRPNWYRDGTELNYVAVIHVRLCCSESCMGIILL